MSRRAQEAQSGPLYWSGGMDFHRMSQFESVFIYNILWTAAKAFIGKYPLLHIAAGKVQVWICSKAHPTPLTLPKHRAENLLTATTVDRYTDWSLIQALKLLCVIYAPLEVSNTAEGEKLCQNRFPKYSICYSSDWRFISICVLMHSSLSFYSIHSFKMKHLFNWGKNEYK